jgi:hypothetical protein
MSNLEEIDPNEDEEIKEALENKEENIEKKESKRERFDRLSPKRLANALDKIRILGNCSNEVLYEYSFNDVEKIINTLNKAIQKLEVRYHFPIQTLEEGNSLLVSDSKYLIIYCPKHKEHYEVEKIEENNFSLKCGCKIQINKIDRYKGKYLNS